MIITLKELFFILTLLLLLAGILFFNHFEHDDSDITRTPYECGFVPFNSGYQLNGISFFCHSILFLVWDLEVMVLLFFIGFSGKTGNFTLIVFLLLILVSTYIEIKNGLFSSQNGGRRNGGKNGVLIGRTGFISNSLYIAVAYNNNPRFVENKFDFFSKVAKKIIVFFNQRVRSSELFRLLITFVSFFILVYMLYRFTGIGGGLIEIVFPPEIINEAPLQITDAAITNTLATPQPKPIPVSFKTWCNSRIKQVVELYPYLKGDIYASHVRGENINIIQDTVYRINFLLKKSEIFQQLIQEKPELLVDILKYPEFYQTDIQLFETEVEAELYFHNEQNKEACMSILKTGGVYLTDFPGKYVDASTGMDITYADVSTNTIPSQFYTDLAAEPIITHKQALILSYSTNPLKNTLTDQFLQQDPAEYVACVLKLYNGLPADVKNLLP